jgi:hypothetical protein
MKYVISITISLIFDAALGLHIM